jgi:circadian clock protein KaiC
MSTPSVIIVRRGNFRLIVSLLFEDDLNRYRYREGVSVEPAAGFGQREADLDKAKAQLLRRMPSGIDGFDEIADGGLPRGGITVVLGGAGAGKTIFGAQVLAKGAQKDSERGVLVAFEESAEKILENVSTFTWSDSARSGGVEVVDARLSQSVEQGGEFDLVGFLAVIGAKAKATDAKRIVFDGFDVLLGYLRDPILIRREVFRLREWVHTSGISAIVTAKADAADAHAPSDYDFLQFMADCVVTLHHRVSMGTALRFLRVAKYRGATHSANEFPFTITTSGIEVAASTVSEVTYPASTERISTGVERLDAMLSGGYHRGSSILITGAPGTAKTSLSSAFAYAAVLRGERTLYVSFDESPDQIVRNVASIGFDLRPHVSSGNLVLHSLRGRAENPEAHVTRMRALLRDVAPKNFVVDPLSALEQRGCEADAEAAALHVLDFAKSAGITIVSTSLLGNSLPLSEQTPLNISTIADTWIHVSYVSQGGERNRALTIVKSRGTGHSNQVRELVLTRKGITLADVYTAGGQVLMGTLRWEKENEERRMRATALVDAKLQEEKAAMALAETDANISSLSRTRAIQEAELAQLRSAANVETERQALEADEMRNRRQADVQENPPGLPEGSGP